MPGGDALDPVAVRAGAQGREFDGGVAEDAGIGRAPGGVLAEKVASTISANSCAQVQPQQGQAQRVGDGFRIPQFAFAAAVHHTVCARDLVALLLQQQGGRRAVHAAGEPDENPRHQ